MSTSPASLAEEFLPVYDVSDAVAVVVAADVDTTWRALPSGHGGLLDVVRDDAEATR